MPLRFNGKDLNKEDYIKIVEDAIPATNKKRKIKFVLVGAAARPRQVLTDNGPILRKEGERSIASFDTVNLTIKGVENEGVLQYYTNVSNRVNPSGMVVPSYEPAYINFIKHEIVIDAKADPALVYFLLMHSENEKNATKVGKVPLFRLLMDNEGAKRSVASIELEDSARAAARDLRQKNSKQFKMFCLGIGITDFDEKVGYGLKESEKDWESVMDRVYSFIKKDPKGAMEMMNDASVNIPALANECIEAKIVEVAGNKIVWGESIVANPSKREITKIPRQYTNKEDAIRWFGTKYLKEIAPEMIKDLEDELLKFQVGGKNT